MICPKCQLWTDPSKMFTNGSQTLCWACIPVAAESKDVVGDQEIGADVGGDNQPAQPSTYFPNEISGRAYSPVMAVEHGQFTCQNLDQWKFTVRSILGDAPPGKAAWWMPGPSSRGNTAMPLHHSKAAWLVAVRISNLKVNVDKSTGSSFGSLTIEYSSPNEVLDPNAKTWSWS